MHLRDEDRIEDQALNLTSMTDLVFLMLVFFLCATTFLDPERALDLELPPAAHATEQPTQSEELVINIARDGSVTVAGRAVARERLAGELRRIASTQPARAVTLRGDRRVAHEDVVAVMDACGAAGLTQLSVGTLQAR